MRRLFIVGAKIVGLVCIFWAITATLQIMSFMGMSFSGMSRNPSVYISILFNAIGAAAYLLLSICFTIILLFRTEWLADKVKLYKDSDVPHRPELNTLLNLGIILVGLYILAITVPGLGKSVSTMFGMLFRVRERDNILPYIVFLYLMPLIADIFKVAIGLIFVFMPGRLISFTERWRKKFDYKPTQAQE